jgi:trimeric autotransporter adhesin
MKQHFFILLFACYTIGNSYGQNAVGIGTTTPHASSILDMQTTVKGMLIPRMSSTQRNAISSPAKGLLLFDNDSSSFWFYNGTTWKEVGTGNNGWGLSGNAGTNPLINFIGTTDAQPFSFRLNNTYAGKWDPVSSNYFIGLNAGHDVSTGSHNISYGSLTLGFNTTGSFNTAMGSRALASNTGGTFNTASGADAMHDNTDGSYNIAAGAEAMRFNTTGGYNAAYGYRALYSNLIGGFNIAIGHFSLSTNTIGSYNTAIGFSSLQYNTTGNGNTATGVEALYVNSTGASNTATGNGALRANTTGSQNTAIGAIAMIYPVGGTANTAIGYAALSTYDGNANTVLGAHSDLTSNFLFNATAIGYNTRVDASMKVRIGNTDVGSIGGQVSWTTFSDGRFKINVQEDVKGLAFIKKLRPVTYTVDNVSLKRSLHISDSLDKFSCNNNPPIRQTGFIAQEVEDAAISIGYSFSGVDKPQLAEGHYGIRYAEFVVPLVKAVQEQQQMIQKLKEQVELLEKRIHINQKK